MVRQDKLSLNKDLDFREYHDNMTDGNQSKLAMAALGVASLMLAGYGIYRAVRTGPSEEEESALAAEGLTDPDFASNHFLTKQEAQSRSELVSDVSYVLALGLTKGSKTYNGRITIDYTLAR